MGNDSEKEQCGTNPLRREALTDGGKEILNNTRCG